METATLNSTSLYQRLGERKGISNLVNDIVDAHMNNPVIKARFLPYKDSEKLEHTKELLIQFLCTGSGGEQCYTGREMAEAHRGMNISDGEYMSAIDDIMQVLKKHNIDEQTQKDILFIGYSLKDQIIAK
jgi:hemoglobin